MTVYASAAIWNNLEKILDRHERSGIAVHWNGGGGLQINSRHILMHAQVWPRAYAISTTVPLAGQGITYINILYREWLDPYRWRHGKCGKYTKQLKMNLPGLITKSWTCKKSEPTPIHLTRIWLNWWNKRTDDRWRIYFLPKSEISNISFCLAPRSLLLSDQRSFGLIRHMFPNHNRLFDPNCKMIFFICKWLWTPKLSCLSQHAPEIIMSVITHYKCDLHCSKEQSDQG